jgi:hypothetical protein
VCFNVVLASGLSRLCVSFGMFSMLLGIAVWARLCVSVVLVSHSVVHRSLSQVVCQFWFQCCWESLFKRCAVLGLCVFVATDLSKVLC